MDDSKTNEREDALSAEAALGDEDVRKIDPAAADHTTVGAPWHRETGSEAGAGSQSIREDVEQRVRGAAGGGLDDAADAVRRLGRKAHDRGGVASRAEPVAQRFGSGLENAAGYVRSHELGDMRLDLEREVRNSPIRSLFIAGAAGFLIGKLIR